MFRLKIWTILLSLMMLISPLLSCKRDGNSTKGLEYQTINEIRDIKPEKTVKVKLKRDKKGEYSWELSGDNVDKIIEVDKRLRESIKD